MNLHSPLLESRMGREAVAFFMSCCVAILTGCGFGVPLKNAEAVDEQGRRSALIKAGQSTRTSVRAELGEPWLQSRFWGFDVYLARDTAKELGGPVILILPIPIGVFTAQVAGYVLVTYDEKGYVTNVSSGNASRSTGQQDALMLRADGLNLGIEKVAERGPHLMADADRLAAYLGKRRATDTCTIILACEEGKHQKWQYEGCPDRAAIDDAEPIDLQPFFGSCEPGKSCPPRTMPSGPYVRVPTVYPITLSPGKHRILMTSSTFKGRHESKFACTRGEVLYGVVRGHVSWDWWGPRTSTLDTTVSFSNTIPEQWSSYSVLLYRGKRWYVAPEPDLP